VDTGGGTDTGATGGGSRTGLIVLLVVIRRAGAARGLGRPAPGQGHHASRQRSLEEARREIKAQLDPMANTILEISDKVSLSDSREATGTWKRRQDLHRSLRGVRGATDLARLEEISGRLDEARWQLDAAAALADGKPGAGQAGPVERSAWLLRPHPRRASRDDRGAHRRWHQTVAGLRGRRRQAAPGQQPDTRMIEGGRAGSPGRRRPKSYGGGGLDWLDVFAVIVGGMAGGRSFDWGAAELGDLGAGHRFRWLELGSRRDHLGGGSIPRMRSRAGQIRMRPR